MKKIMLMATMMVATLAASAQYDAGTWSLNVRYGFTGATMINTPDMDLSLALGPGSTINLPGGDLEASATGGGHVVGLELEKQLTKRFSISGGLDWIMAGTGWKDHKWKDGDVEYKLKDASVKTHYLAVPVTANLYVWKGLALHAGVQAAYLTGARREGTVTYEDDADYTVSMSLSDRSQFNKIDISIPVGISYEWSNHLFVDARYNIGLSNVTKEKTYEDKDLKNAYLQLSVGYKIKLNH